MLELNREVRNLYKAYEHKPLKPETALEIASDFVLDLINVFGDNLDEKTPLKEGWKQFAPFEFILELNETLRKYKEQGYEGLEDTERAMLADHGILLGSLMRSGLHAHADTFADEEHFQIPNAVAKELIILTETE